MKITENNLRKIVKHVMIESMSLSSLEHDIYSLMQDVEDSMSPDDGQMNDVRKLTSYISELAALNDLDDDIANPLLNSLEELGNLVSSADSLDDETKENLVSNLKEIHDYILYDLLK